MTPRFSSAARTGRRLLAAALVLGVARWGLIPPWWKEAKPPRFAHNARLEEAALKPLWRDAMRAGRCLVPAQGWYEWRESDRQPFYFARRDGRLACFAGLMSVFDGKLTCAVLSTAAAGSLGEVHSRMPVALPPDGEDAWLESGILAADTDTIEHYAVRRLVNSSAAEGPELIEPIAA